MKACSQLTTMFSSPKQPVENHSALRQTATLTVGIGSDHALCRNMLERVVCDAAAFQGVQVRILTTPCWELLDAIFDSRKKPDLLIFHHRTLSRAIDPVAKAICQRYRPVRILFLGGRIPEGDCFRYTGKGRDKVMVYSSLRRPNQTALRCYLTRQIQWLLEHGAGQSSAIYAGSSPKGGERSQ